MDDFAWNLPQGGQGQNPETCFAEFFLHPIRMGAKSDAAGREIFEDREYVRIIIPGDSKTVVEREVRDEDRRRFSRQYEAFKATGVTPTEGTPLAQWPSMSPARIRELNAMNIFTVEHVAGLSDAIQQKVGIGARELVVKAQAFLKSAASSSIDQQMATELMQAKVDVQRLTKMTTLLATRLEAAEARLKEIPNGGA